MTMETNVLIAHMDDLANKAVKIGYTASKFLTPAETQSITENFARRHDIALTPDGGYEGAERIRMVFTNPDWGTYDREDLFSALKIVHRPQDSLGHRDILGALMSLGIERETVGDIIVDEQLAIVVCMPELSGYIAGNISKAGRVGIKISEIALNDIPARKEELTIKTGTIASMRLDAVLSVAFGLSRSKVAELVAAGRVSLNHQICLQAGKVVSEQSLLSVRGLGRAKLLEVGGTTKKGRIFIQIGLYGR